MGDARVGFIIGVVVGQGVQARRQWPDAQPVASVQDRSVAIV
jgi:hypothetical protein